MKKGKLIGRILGTAIVFAMIVGLASLTAPSGSVLADDPVINFPDLNLEASIRAHIGKPTGDIYQSDLDGLTYFHASSKGIAELTGLEYCIDLTTVYLYENQISDISPLSSLPLHRLELWNNEISNISPLAANIALGAGDYVKLQYNHLDLTPSSQAMNDIQTLLDRGVNFQYEPQEEYHLTISTTAGGSVTNPSVGTFSYIQGSVVSLVASPNAGYYFVNWTGDVATLSCGCRSTTITMYDNYEITANFALLPPTSTYYQLTISSTAGGSVTNPGTGTFTYVDGGMVSLVASPNTGYKFVKWSGDVGTVADVNAPSTAITMNDNCSITANFEQIPPEQFGLTISSTAGGSVTVPGEGAFTYDEGGVVSLVATPASSYQFVNWTGNVTTIADVNAASTNITMHGNYEITANFEAVSLPSEVPTVTTQAATNVTTNSATLNMNYTMGNFSPVQVRFGYKKSTDSSWSSTDWVSKVADGSYTMSLAGLDSGTQYEFKAQLKYNDIVIEGTTLQFTTATPTSTGWCFIATAAYGTAMAEEVQILREFRDRYLLTNSVGQRLVDIYYSISPPIADFITEHPRLKPVVRVGLMPVVAMCSVVFETLS
jgi:hypothetical protein